MPAVVGCVVSEAVSWKDRTRQNSMQSQGSYHCSIYAKQGQISVFMRLVLSEQRKPTSPKKACSMGSPLQVMSMQLGPGCFAWLPLVSEV